MSEGKLSVELAENRGAKAYRDGDLKSDNPHEKDSDLFAAWAHGFNVEKNYWEGKL